MIVSPFGNRDRCVLFLTSRRIVDYQYPPGRDAAARPSIKSEFILRTAIKMILIIILMGSQYGPGAATRDSNPAADCVLRRSNLLL